MEREVDLSDFHNWAIENGKTLAFPVSKKHGEMFAYAPNGLKDIEKGLLGIYSPIISKSKLVSPEEIDVILTPCVGFDENNCRIGHGGGYYDRYLPKAVYSKKVIIAFEAQKLDDLARDKFDCILDKTITER